jgi:hypothetical protein
MTRRSWQRGEIYLEDDETIAFITKKPFRLQPPPPPRYSKLHTGTREDKNVPATTDASEKA